METQLKTQVPLSMQALPTTLNDFFSTLLFKENYSGNIFVAEWMKDNRYAIRNRNDKPIFHNLVRNAFAMIYQESFPRNVLHTSNVAG